MFTPTSLLVIEPHENLRDAYASVLRFAGYRVHEASCAVTAQEQLCTARPSLVLLNPHLPTVDEAMELVRRCRADRRFADVTWVAICEDKTARSVAREPDFDIVLRAPLRYQDLIQAAGIVCGNPAVSDSRWELCFS